eukprot:TRINITY_DN4788_c0_g1_i1.p1 TRINITY_DN4788_c0_g1~~TRINITY_DN4788_c0_g1_i1.p1  ORF type:complete len:444 (-),score=123.68 TRINITY_DN4788_c0_g1_i1:197-1477(-)
MKFQQEPIKFSFSTSAGDQAELNYHQKCFKCSKCSVSLSIDDAVGADNGLEAYCKDCAESARNTSIETPSRSATEKAQAQKAIASRISANQQHMKETCHLCEKVVFLPERIEVHSIKKDQKLTFHKSCFKCKDCGVSLEVSSYGTVDKAIYCPVHLKSHLPQMHKSEGAYFMSPLASALPVDETEAERLRNPPEPEIWENSPSLQRREPQHYSEESNKRTPEERLKAQEAIASKISSARDSAKEICSACSKTVYIPERVEVTTVGKKDIYHKACFKCSECKVSLDLSNYGSINLALFCLVHLRSNQPQMSSGAYFLSPLAARSPDVENHEQKFEERNEVHQEKTLSEKPQQVISHKAKEDLTSETVVKAAAAETSKPPEEDPREAERRRRREERERARLEEEKKWEAERIQRENDRAARRQARANS